MYGITHFSNMNKQKETDGVVLDESMYETGE